MGPQSISIASGWYKAVENKRGMTALEVCRLSRVIFNQTLPLNKAADILDRVKGPLIGQRFRWTLRALHTDKQRKGSVEEVLKFSENHNFIELGQGPFFKELENQFPIICHTKRTALTSKGPKNIRVLKEDLICFTDAGLTKSVESLLPNIREVLIASPNDQHFFLLQLCNKTLLQNSKPIRDLLIELLNPEDRTLDQETKGRLLTDIIEVDSLSLMMPLMPQKTRESIIRGSASGDGSLLDQMRHIEMRGFSRDNPSSLFPEDAKKDKTLMIESFRSQYYPDIPKLPPDNIVAHVLQHADDLPLRFIFYVLSLSPDSERSPHEESLYPLALALIKEAGSLDPKTVIKPDDITSHYELRAYTTAIITIIRKHIPLLNGLDLDEISERLLRRGKVMEQHDGGADDSFRIGQNITEEDGGMEQVFMTLAHETGHNFLDRLSPKYSHQIDYIHEFVGDLFAFTFAQIMGWGYHIPHYFEQLSTYSALKDPAIFRYTMEPHIIARCQMEVVIKWFQQKKGQLTSRIDWTGYLNSILNELENRPQGFKWREIPDFGKLACDIIHPSKPGHYCDEAFFVHTPYIPEEVWEEYGDKEAAKKYL